MRNPGTRIALATLVATIVASCHKPAATPDELVQLADRHQSKLLEQELVCNPHDSHTLGRTLYVAAVRGFQDEVELLIKHGADPNFLYEGGTPLIGAVESRNPAVVRLLLQKGRKPAPDKYTTPLFIAAGYGDSEMAEMLLNAGDDPNFVSKANQSVMYQAIGSGNSTRILKLLLDHGARVDTNALFRAVARNHTKQLKLLDSLPNTKARKLPPPYPNLSKRKTA